MTVLKRGSRGNDVIWVQEQLVKAGFNVDTDGIFGGGTQTAVTEFQKQRDLDADGMVGPATRAALDAVVPGDAPPVDEKALTEEDIQKVAEQLNVEVPAIKAVYEVESRGKGFIANGKPKILFEGHIFWRQLVKRNINPEPLVPGNENILHKKWTKDFYREDQYERLEKAKAIQLEAALASASWGTFQIMGFNHEACGFSSVTDFVDSQYINEGQHLTAFGAFVTTEGLVVHLRNKNWAAFAKGYNGPAYAENKYDQKLAAAYARHNA